MCPEAWQQDSHRQAVGNSPGRASFAAGELPWAGWQAFRRDPPLRTRLESLY